MYLEVDENLSALTYFVRADQPKLPKSTGILNVKLKCDRERKLLNEIVALWLGYGST